MVQEDSIKSKILVICGPTGVGKSAFAVECALRFNGIVIGADSMQIYRKLDIGTGKVTEEEKRGILHKMIDIIEPDMQYSVGQYLTDAKKQIDLAIQDNKLPIIVGGTALYINALLNGMNLTDTARSDEVRSKWKKLALDNGNAFVYDRLYEIDPVSAIKIGANDLKRLIRALEIYEVTGKRKSEIATASDCEYDYRFIILSDDRELLYQRIENRVDKMIELGLENEVKSLAQYSDCQSMQAIGYKQFIEYFNGKFGDLNSVIEEIKKLSRNYAKRQLTFLRGMKATNKNWITPLDFNAEYINIEKFLTNGELNENKSINN